MARPAARGLKVFISGSNQETAFDDIDGRPARNQLSALDLPSPGLLNHPSPSLYKDKSSISPSAIGSPFYENDDSESYNGSLPSSSSSATPTLPQSSADRALAEYALLEEIRLSQQAIQLFFNNDISGAKQLLEDKVDENMYAAVSYSTILYLKALMTFTQEDARAASKALRDTQTLCSKKCRGRFSRSKRTEEQVHAELCHAECGLMLSALVLSEDPGLTALIKSGIRFKSSHSTYQTCIGILRDREWTNPELKAHFESGVRLGIGAFNLIFSCVPSKHAKYLSVVGFRGVAKIGYSELEAGASLGALRSVLCSLVLVGWETYGKIILGSGMCNIEAATDTLGPLLELYPNGAVVLFLYGRLAQLKGQFSDALSYFDRSIHAQSDWIQFQHLCLWESMWCHCFMMEYEKAADLAYFLFRENQWSKSTYAYLTAAFLLMLNKHEAVLSGHKVTVKEIMKEIIARKQKIAGQSIPPEKLAEKRYKRFVEHEKNIIFPAYECLYFFGGMAALANRPDLVQDILALLNSKLTQVSSSSGSMGKKKSRIHEDSVYMVNFMRGVCYSYLNQVEKACEVLGSVVEAEKHILEDKFLPPHAAIEIASLKLRMDDLTGAMQYCVKAISFKNYFMQAKLEVRIAATIEVIEERQSYLEDNVSLLERGSICEFYTPPSSPELPR
ncbi:hypothetical protein RvY_14660 [Ramazzottius varieornatus]|uniref:Uncharacterized protein n=1 Tax=Ramazzottius varieornatus TaxID=947166 RepID=A0A1D1VS31_RAMVA|nr:hypothetical protein RvY_14660 [Ramazzottius varieornatus]